MSLCGVSRTGLPGRNAQSTKQLGTIADKAVSGQFSSLILEGNTNVYNSGAVATSVRHTNSAQASLAYVTSPTALGIQGGRPLDDGSPTTVLNGIGDRNLKGVPSTSGGSMPLGRPLDDGSLTTVLNAIVDAATQLPPASLR